MLEDKILNYEPGKYRYGRRGSNPQGYAEDLTRCFEQVSDGWFSYQCSRKRGHGYKGLFCKQHAKRYAYLESQEATQK